MRYRTRPAAIMAFVGLAGTCLGVVSPVAASASDESAPPDRPANEPTGPRLSADPATTNGSGTITGGASRQVAHEAVPTYRPANAPPLRWASHPRWVTLDGTYCIGVYWVAGATQEQADQRANAGQVAFESESNISFWYDVPPVITGTCPAAQATPIPAAVVRDAAHALVYDQLPRPVPHIPPGRALTGLPAYLVTNHDLEFEGVHDVRVGNFEVTFDIRARGRTRVDWGDGTVDVYDVPGTPWPSGQVSHIYEDTGDVTVSVVDRWQVQFSASGDATLNSSFVAVLDPVTIDQFRVNQIQTVRVTSR